MANISNIIRGLQVLEKYDRDGEIDAQHDIIYAGPHHQNIVEDDMAILEDSGWHWDQGNDCWYHFT